VRASWNTATAPVASGDRSSRCDRIAPAPAWSSNAGRRLSSPVNQRSPAAMTVIVSPSARAAFATADAFRRHPARTGLPAAAAVSAIVAPLGDGRTMFSPDFAFTNVAGDSEYGCSAFTPSRWTARDARTDLA